MTGLVPIDQLRHAICCAMWASRLRFHFGTDATSSNFWTALVCDSRMEMSAGLCGHARIDVIYITLSLFSASERDRIIFPQSTKPAPNPRFQRAFVLWMHVDRFSLSCAETQLLVIVITSLSH